MSAHKHYLFPPRFSEQFAAASFDAGRPINLEDFAIGVDIASIPGFSSYDEFNGAWLDAWTGFFSQHEPGSYTRNELMEHAMRLSQHFGIDR